MSCYDLHTATEKNQKAREALEAFMSRLQATGPSLWQRWGVLEAGSARQPKLDLLELLRCWLLIHKAIHDSPAFCSLGSIESIGFHRRFCMLVSCHRTPRQPEGLTRMQKKDNKWREIMC